MTLLLVAVLSLATLLSAARLPRTEDVEGIMRLPISRVNRSSLSAKRQIDTGLDNPEYGTIYMVDIEIGSPPQPVSVQIDTGSSDLWVDPDCATSGSVAFCQSYPVYNPYASTTALDTGNFMSLEYGKGSCYGEYLLDTVVLGGKTIVKQQFGWAFDSTSLPTGIMGISWGVELIGYYNIIDQLALQGITKSRAFSLDLGNVDTAEGSIIFGGIDTMKYSGPLEKRPIIPANQAPDGDRYWIYMSSVGITKPGASPKLYTGPTYENPVFLDSGGTLSRLPADLVASMLADFPGAVNQGNGVYSVDCSYRSQAGTLDFGFGNTVIHVPYHEFIWMNGVNSCIFGAVANDASNVDWVLGDTFLRSAYVVYDQDNRNLLLANSANCGTHIIPIGSGVDAVPSVTGACQASVTPTSSTSLTSISTKTSSSTKSTTGSMTTTSTSTKSSSTSSTKSTTNSITTTSTSTSTKLSSTSSHTTTTSTTKSLSTTITTKTSTSTSKTATATAGILGYHYVGCFKDSSPHSMTKILANNSMTIELCLEVAHGASPPYAFAGVEYGRECWAARTSPAAATPTSGKSACTMACMGNAIESCGGRKMFNLWASATPTPK